MVFLIPLLMIIGLIFSIDYFYYNDENAKIKTMHSTKEKTQKNNQEQEKYIKKLLENE